MQGATLQQRSLILEIAPKSKERPRFNGRVAHLSHAYRAWIDNCSALMSELWIDPPLEKVLCLHCHFYGVAIGDTDNLIGSVMDAGNKIIWTDDSVRVINKIVAQWTHTKKAEAHIKLEVIWIP